MSERAGILAAVLSSAFGGTAPAATRDVIGATDPVTLAALLAVPLLGEPIGLHLIAGLVAVGAWIWIASTGSAAL